ncbi:MAG: outer membrane protein assembly factor BamA [Lysobacterales bacterium CG02_land_8_20_14_3_00_62_12]|nr:MAG: outer membrane protein assembly factor BamA [Xanthomonadales bacterium CG02_land_8_20_14_3_00_62_12]
MRRLAALLLLIFSLASLAADFDAFVVADIRLEGLTRIPAGTVFASFPIEKGDRVDRIRAAEAVRALFKTGFFNDIQVSRQGDILVLTLVERPAIAQIELIGNKDIKTEDLTKGLKEIGLAEGETFDRLQLDRITQELTRQYNNRGKYSVTIKPQVEELDRNRVNIKIVIKEGKASKIRHINIVGNDSFPQKDILDGFESGVTNWLSWYKKNDQYSREKLSGDMEKLVSFYQDRGYVDFSIDSTQVAISPNKMDLYLTANVREGAVYTLTDVKLTGDLVLSEAIMRSLLFARVGQTYSRKQFENSAEAMTRVLSNVGYAFAEVTPIPDIDRDHKTIGITLLVKPGKRVYVRRINFAGNERTQDEVLRREMRQVEGSWFSQAAIDRSKTRLRRLGFFSDVTIETPKVAGSEDQVDVLVTVKEQSAGTFQFGVGYSQFQGLITTVSVTQRNFMGRGNSIGVTVQNNSFSKRLDLNFVDPYFTDDGISVGYQLSYAKQDFGDANLAQFTTNTAAGSVQLGIPFSETDTVSLALGLDRNQINTTDGITPQVLINQLTRELGPRAAFPFFHTDDNGNLDPNDIQDDDGIPGIDPVSVGPNRRWNINTMSLSAGWARDSRNKFFAPTAGSFQRVFGEIALPGSDFQYWKLNYEYAHYFPLNKRYSILTRAEVGYGDGYGGNSSLPFYKNFFAGGTRSVRGFEDNTLGPFDLNPGFSSSFRQPLGGAFKTVGTAELIFPTPFTKSDSDSSQFSYFVDVGNVFDSPSSWDAGELRASTGLSFKWQAPVGPIIINLVKPLRSKSGDRTETLQFTFGSQF